MAGLGPAEARAALSLILARVARTLDELHGRFPLYCEATGLREARWVTTDDGNWCAGYWIGLLWLAAKHATSCAQRRRMVQAAYGHLPALKRQPTGHIFAGVNWYYAGFLGFDITGDAELRQCGLAGAEMMLALYDAAAQQIPIGIYTTAPPNAASKNGPVDRRHLAAVDVVHTSVPILLRAHGETGKTVYRDVAKDHVRRHCEWFVRTDGSTGHLVAFAPESGRPVRVYSTLARDDAGCWARGFGWHVAGMAHAYVDGGRPADIDILRRSMEYYRAHGGADLIPAWDLAIGDPSAARDASAAALIAYGLLLLRERPESQTNDLVALGENVLAALLRRCLVRDTAAPNAGAVLHGCYRHPTNIATDAELIWTDFYVAAALDQILAPR